MLRRLVREALFHVHRDRRRLAAIVLAASPYARAIAEASLVVVRDSDEATAGLTSSLLRRLGHVLARAEVSEMALSEGRKSLRASAFVTVGLSRGTLPEQMADHLCQTARTSSGTRLGHAATFALGMSGHPHLKAMAAQKGPSQSAARWWTSVGPALHDD